MEDELHQRLIRIGLEAAREHGFALGGGQAVRAHRVVERLSDDVDLFTTWDRRAELAPAVELVAQAYRSAGLAVAVRQLGETRIQLLVTDPTTNPEADLERATLVELLVDPRLHPPVEMAIGPVLHRDDVAANKVTALFDRAEARDFIDVVALLHSGHYTRAHLLSLGAQKDHGFDPQIFAGMLSRIARFKDEDFLRYGITRAQLAEVRAETAD
ncbi:nucleotidyl transferase AbiEii/AbiGii toxin family protein [Streptomyces sp. BPTC-684]|uniref:nucleotidyl transferase AbiEii/AbiGii toxin family protein n=1 Tax=Streptomyces sp. BPTC-684 TaxID=3043734 RepID=UPI0024B16996|nr:nucleotidyl transferase AbiEii/AbiGii toxin family protein [Streptomyces sp. BPTC-684]WHM37905.1 nucleotidyl transferase AbiEii/AbiGii toxin family protein [Streptomyces sp. BPTC-684]